MHVDCFVIVKFKEENPISTVQSHSVVLSSQSEADMVAMDAAVRQTGDDIYTYAALPASLSFGITKLQAESERNDDDYLALEGTNLRTF